MIKKYIKKPVIIEAILAAKDNLDEIEKFTKYEAKYYQEDNAFLIKTLEGLMRASIGDYIIKGIAGEFYPCKPDIFKQSYSEVEDGC